MDELKIGSKWMKNVIAKAARAALKKKLGLEAEIQLYELSAELADGKARIHLNIDAELTKDELVKLLKNVGLN